MGLFFSLFLPSPFPCSCHDPPRCSPQLSRSSSSLLVSAASTRRLIRRHTFLPMPPSSQSKDRQGRTSVGQPLTRPRHARTPTVSARRARKEISLNICSFVFQLVNSIDDFCIFAPPNPGADSVIANTEVRRVRARHGMRLISSPSQAHRSGMVYEGM